MYYIKGDPDNPKEVEETLLYKYPTASNKTGLTFIDSSAYYYVNPKTNIIECAHEKKFFEIFGEELTNNPETEEVVMYQGVFKCRDEFIYEKDILCNSLAELKRTASEDGLNLIGYKKVSFQKFKK